LVGCRKLFVLLTLFSSLPPPFPYTMCMLRAISYQWLQVLVTGSLHLVGDVLKLLKRWLKWKSTWIKLWKLLLQQKIT
jgi:hypothetical protein